MLNIGRKQKLVVVKKVEFGIYLGETREAGEKERVLLPIKQVPEGTKEGDELEVFLYRDSSDRLIATTREPKLVLGELAVLNVAATGKIGAFLDWGLEKDLFLPLKQQTRRLHPGDEVLVSLYIDKSDRLCATMKVYHFLKTNSPYVVGDTVKGRIYEISGNFGVFVAVDDRYSGQILSESLPVMLCHQTEGHLQIPRSQKERSLHRLRSARTLFRVRTGRVFRPL